MMIGVGVALFLVVLIALLARIVLQIKNGRFDGIKSRSPSGESSTIVTQYNDFSHHDSGHSDGGD